ncbi:transglycosylase SLT domain-containing protein [Lichenicoccus sp.]|uniref:transglycosylase SLT domain-containing protein n=1 Tax=Lichenicoccus sp. TaxID=2781899 RepID=UPI003D132558
MAINASVIFTLQGAGMRRLVSWILLLPWLALVPTLAWAADDAALCQHAILQAEQGSGVPNQLLDAISRVESGRHDAEQGGVRAWPWTINVQGQGHYYATRAEAVAAAAGYRASGIQSMDVGCTQINLMYHPQAFRSLNEAFDPLRNAAYAASFLTDLFHQTGSWPHAAAAYHSQTPELGTDYQRRVLEAWAEPIDGRQVAAPTHRAARGPLSRSLPASPGNAPATQAGPMSTQVQVATAATGVSFGRPVSRPAGAPLGGYGRVIRLQAPGPTSAGIGRSLSAYRLMPVAMLAAARRPVAHN